MGNGEDFPKVSDVPVVGAEFDENDTRIRGAKEVLTRSGYTDLKARKIHSDNAVEFEASRFGTREVVTYEPGDSPDALGAITIGERETDGVLDVAPPNEDEDDAEVVEVKPDLTIQDRRALTKKALIEQFGRGALVPNTRAPAWLDVARNSMWVVRADAEKQEITVGDSYNFGNRDRPDWRKWLGESGGGWSDQVSEDEKEVALMKLRSARGRKDIYVAPKLEQHNQLDEEAQLRAELARLEGHESGTAVRGPQDSGNHRTIRNAEERSTPKEGKEKSRIYERYGWALKKDSHGRWLTKAPGESEFQLADARIEYHGQDRHGNPVRFTFTDDLRRYIPVSKELSEERKQGNLDRLGNKISQEIFGKHKRGSHSEESEEVSSWREKVKLAKLQKEHADIVAPPKKQEEPPKPEKLSLTDEWEYAGEKDRSHIAERANAALRARKYEHLTEYQKVNKAKFFYDTAEKWGKIPWWKKLGISAGLLGATQLGMHMGWSKVAAFTFFSWMTWGAAALAAGTIAFATTAYTYLKKRNSRHPALFATLAGLGFGGVALGSKFLSEQLQSFIPVDSSGGEVGPPQPDATAVAVAPHGTPELLHTPIMEVAGNGGDIQSVLQDQFFGEKGTLKPFGLSQPAQQQFLTLTNQILEHRSSLAGDIVSGGDLSQIGSTQTIHLKPLGSSNFTNTLTTVLNDPSNAGTYSNLIAALKDKGGADGLKFFLERAYK